ncbi:TonB-dependent receptor plug domain-containing protein [Sphingomonas sp. GlSt437]|uniref:TonB-dependent receptor plug domain-containing protein n=1 Tax=Sphingomonas sp. GlSt437 TaxID=3389970 RepID=UPI003A87629F
MKFTKSIALTGTALAAVFAAGSASAQTRNPAADVPDTTATAPAGNDIIVTGTRVTGITVAESATPIKVLGEETLSHVGQPNLNQVLTQLVPSFTAQAFGGDTANLTLSARLRGLSPNHTLVLVNGKRRHGTANLAVLSGPYQGAATADLDLISPSSIKRIEVLEDGAAAQYGSDAIAGVINIILKDDNEGGDGYATAGQNYKTGGDTYAETVHLATKVGDNGFVNLTLFHRFHNFTQIGGLDRRVTDTSGNLRTTLSAAQQALYSAIPGFPDVNKINGDAKSNLTNFQFNSGYDFGGVHAYAFGSYSKRSASAYENLRVPDRILGNTPPNGSSGVLGAPGTTIPFPNGFNPREAISEDDYSITGGLEGTVVGLHFDLSTTYGQDKNLISTLDSANRSLFLDTGFTPRNFYDGSFTATEFTANADFSTEFDIGFAKPVNIAFGGEYRRNTYAIGSGDPGSIYKEGGQSYPGFRPSDATTNSRNNKSLYLDIAATPVAGLKLDGAVRYESYSDFGDNVIFKVNGRYDFSDAFALRGTVSTGFRAPTLAESFYSATNVSPTAAFVQLPANSAAAKLIGFQNLKPEKSTNFSVGIVARPLPRLTITLDAYQVEIRDRIVGTGSIFGSGGATNFPIVTAAILANGNVLDPTVVQTGINIFTNGADTRTRGVELTASYRASLGDVGTVNLTLSGNYNDTSITRLGVAPATLGGIALFDPASQSNLTTASPKVKVIGSAAFDLGKFSATARGTVFGVTSNLTSPNGGTFYLQRIPAAFIADLEVGYQLTKGIQLTVGANNLFDKRPPTVQLVPGTTNFTIVTGNNVLDAPLPFSPYGINGGYYYGRVSFKF